MTEDVEIDLPIVAIIRAVGEFKHVGTYMGSWLGLRGWILEAEEAGWIRGKTHEYWLTKKGREAYDVWRLAELPASWAITWGKKFTWPAEMAKGVTK